MKTRHLILAIITETLFNRKLVKTGYITLAITTKTVQEETSGDRTYYISSQYEGFVQQGTKDHEPQPYLFSV